MKKYEKPKSLEQAKIMKTYIEKYKFIIEQNLQNAIINNDETEDFELHIKKLDILLENLKKDFPELFLL